jgi:hypothetical protein
MPEVSFGIFFCVLPLLTVVCCFSGFAIKKFLLLLFLNLCHRHSYRVIRKLKEWSDWLIRITNPNEQQVSMNHFYLFSTLDSYYKLWISIKPLRRNMFCNR